MDIRFRLPQPSRSYFDIEVMDASEFESLSGVALDADEPFVLVLWQRESSELPIALFGRLDDLDDFGYCITSAVRQARRKPV